MNYATSDWAGSGFFGANGVPGVMPDQSSFAGAGMYQNGVPGVMPSKNSMAGSGFFGSNGVPGILPTAARKHPLLQMLGIQ